MDSNEDKYELNDFCRVCRCEALPSRPLFFPCLCTGTIKYVHQDCLTKWLEFSKRENCEVCGHSFRFRPIYAPGTPRVVPISVLFSALLERGMQYVFTCFHCFLVIFAWLVIVPLVACRIYRALFTGSISSILTLPLDILSLDRIFHDCLHGLTLVVLALGTFLGYVWLREMVMFNGGPQWLNVEEEIEIPQVNEDQNSAAPHQDEEHAVLPEDLMPVLEADANLPNFQRQEPFNLDMPLPELPPEQLQRPRRLRRDRPNNQPPIGGPDLQQAAEAMDWDRLIGLDGSFAFIEHVLWLIALNTLFIFIFAFCPYHLGNFTITGLHLEQAIEATKMTNILTTFVGYLILASILIFCHFVFKFAGLYRAGRLAGLFYIYIKIALIYVVEWAIFPVFSGAWIDICSLQMLNSTLKERVQFFFYSPIAFFSFHWIKGMLYTFYIASFVAACKEVLRPGLLLFVHHLTGPDYKMIRWLIIYSLPVYMQKLITSYCLTGILVLLTLWVPSMIIRNLFVGFLPFSLSTAFEEPLDYTIEITFGMMTFDFYADEQLKKFLSGLIRIWSVFVAWILGIRSYLIGDVEFQPGDIIVGIDGRETRAAGDSAENGNQRVHRDHAWMPPNRPPANEEREDVQFVPYKKPIHFKFRLAGLVIIFAITLIIISCTLLIIPLAIGRSVRQFLISSAFIQVLHLIGSPVQMLVENSTNSKPMNNYRLNLKGNDAFTFIIGLFILSKIISLSFFIKKMYSYVKRWPGSSLYNLINSYWSPCLRIFNRMLSLARNIITWLKPDPEHHSGASSLPSASSIHVLTYPNDPTGDMDDFPIVELQEDVFDSYIVPFTQETSSLSFKNKMLRFFQQYIGENTKMREYLSLLSNRASSFIHYVTVMILLIFTLPIMTGLFTELTILTPLRIPAHKSINIDLFESWIFGLKLLHIILFLILTLGQQHWRLHNRLEAVVEEVALRGIRARLIQVIWPVFSSWISLLGLTLTIPYLISEYLSYYIGIDSAYLFRFGYPIQSGLIFGIFFCFNQFKRCRNVYENIKNERYMVGKVLVNLERYNNLIQEPPALDSTQIHRD